MAEEGVRCIECGAALGEEVERAREHGKPDSAPGKAADKVTCPVCGRINDLKEAGRTLDTTRRLGV